MFTLLLLLVLGGKLLIYAHSNRVLCVIMCVMPKQKVYLFALGKLWVHCLLCVGIFTAQGGT